ncbi:SIMPL domain-containing protein [Vibrio tritonius]|uniref:SIMPL domain-containing protein n=1 Tax=Vibrio tritonius TaxID=1435069 RepID=UPI000838645D|nr:SIMPL domain-containing protein [Vibrio tritonius]
MQNYRRALTLLCLGLGFSVSVPAVAQDLSFPHVITTGSATLMVNPDKAVISSQIRVTQPTADAVKKQVDGVVARYTKDLKKKIDKRFISSSNLSISPQYHYGDKGERTLVGYVGSRSVEVTINDLNQLNDHINLALTDGMNQISGIQMGLKDRKAYEDRVLKAAMEDAQNKAQFLAAGFQSKLGQVWQVEYHSEQNTPRYERVSLMQSKAADVSSSYQNSQIELDASVDVIYRIDTH